MPTVAVLGAGSPTGLACVNRLLSATHYDIRAVVRDPTKYSDKLPQDKRVSLQAGDVTDPESLQRALQGCTSVIFTASGRGFWSADSVDNNGVANTARAAKAVGTDHVVLVSSQLVSRHNMLHPIRLILNNIRWGLMDAKLKGEQALCNSGVSYTIIRPGGLSHAPPGARVVTGQGDRGSASGPPISRADVAAVCVAALSCPEARAVTVEIGGSRDRLDSASHYNAHISSLFKDLKKDSELQSK